MVLCWTSDYYHIVHIQECFFWWVPQMQCSSFMKEGYVGLFLVQTECCTSVWSVMWPQWRDISWVCFWWYLESILSWGLILETVWPFPDDRWCILLVAVEISINTCRPPISISYLHFVFSWEPKYKAVGLLFNYSTRQNVFYLLVNCFFGVCGSPQFFMRTGILSLGLLFVKVFCW